jgi:hypothetical protein
MHKETLKAIKENQTEIELKGYSRILPVEITSVQIEALIEEIGQYDVRTLIEKALERYLARIKNRVDLPPK